MKNKLCQCFCMYLDGNSTPIANTPIARTTRVTSSVTSVTVFGFPFAHDWGSKRPRQYGPENDVRRVPKSRSRTNLLLYRIPLQWGLLLDTTNPSRFRQCRIVAILRWKLTFSLITRENIPNWEMPAIRYAILRARYTCNSLQRRIHQARHMRDAQQRHQTRCR